MNYGVMANIFQWIGIIGATFAVIGTIGTWHFRTQNDKAKARQMGLLEEKAGRLESDSKQKEAHIDRLKKAVIDLQPVLTLLDSQQLHQDTQWVTKLAYGTRTGVALGKCSIRLKFDKQYTSASVMITGQGSVESGMNRIIEGADNSSTFVFEGQFLKAGSYFLVTIVSHEQIALVAQETAPAPITP